MKLRYLALSCLLGAFAVVGTSAGAPVAPAGKAPPAAKHVAPTQRKPMVIPPGGFLADSVLLARVGERAVRVKDFVDAYFNSDPQYRPGEDSLSRAGFLRTMINKEVMGIVAMQVAKPLGFEDRATLREHSDRVLANVLYQRMIIDSIHVSEADIQKVYEQFKYEVHLKHIQVPDVVTANRVRSELLGGRLPWSVAVRKYSVAQDKEHDGDMGWRARLGMSGPVALEVWDLKPGSISEAIQDPEGYHIVQVVERRPASAPALEPMRGIIRDQIVSARAGERQAAIQKRLLSKQGVTYDEANIAWAATRFQNPVTMTAQGGPGLQVNPNLPDLTPADLDRVLGRFTNGRVTMRQLVDSYQAMPTMLRPSLTTPDAVKSQVDAVILDPIMIQLARDHGLELDPLAKDLIQKKEEEIRVEHLFQDSIQSHIKVTSEMRHKYYENNKKGFFTYPFVRYAAFTAPSKPAADSLKARLGREKAEAILFADSLAGVHRGSIQERYSNQHGPYQKVLFEELRPGQAMVDGPDAHGDFLILQLLVFDGGHQLTYAQVEQNIDESVQSAMADDQLQRFIARHERGLRIQTHPELVMRISLHPAD